jgi:putative aldouronate transport system substrate-binding protein
MEVDMKKKMVLILLAALVMTPALFAGGGSQGGAAAKATLTPNGQFPLTNTKAELSVLTTVAAWHNDLNNNKVAKWYEDLTNVHVTYTSVNERNMHDESNLLIASGQYPDIIMRSGFSTGEIMDYGTQGVFIPLEDLYDKYGYWIKKAYDPIDTLPAALTQTDGHMYSIGEVNECYHCVYWDKVWLNDTWLKTLNLKTPTTPDEFYNVLKAFKTRDPNGNGRADEIPLVGAANVGNGFEFFLNAYLYWDPTTYLSLNNGKAAFAPVTDAFRDGMRYIRKLVSEGLLDPVTFTQNEEQLRALVTQDTMLVGGMTAWNIASAAGMYNGTPDHRMSYYSVIPPLKGPTGIQYARRNSTGYSTNHGIITDHAKDPALAFRWLEGGFSDAATLVLQYGMEGDGWVKPDAGALGMNERPATRKLVVRPDNSVLLDHAQNIFPGNRTEAVFNGVQTDWSDPLAKFDIEVTLLLNTRPLVPYGDDSKQLPRIINFTVAENAELTPLREQIRTYTGENMVAFAVGNKDIERDWEAFKADLTRMNYARYTQIYQTAYDRQYGKK